MPNTPTPTPARTRTRRGKIARLPLIVREELNRRLADGERGQELVAWLNQNAPVRERLDRYFGGRPVSPQNLSEWKGGGFLDWQRNQQSGHVLRDFLAENEEITDELGDEALADKLANTITVSLLRLFREALAAESDPTERQAVLQIARELARLRRGEHERQKVQLRTEIRKANRG